MGSLRHNLVDPHWRSAEALARSTDRWAVVIVPDGRLLDALFRILQRFAGIEFDFRRVFPKPAL